MQKTKKLFSVLITFCMVLSLFAIGAVPTYADITVAPAAINDSSFVQAQAKTIVYGLDSETVYLDPSTSGYTSGMSYEIRFHSWVQLITNCSYSGYNCSQIAYAEFNGTKYSIPGYYTTGSVTNWNYVLSCFGNTIGRSRIARCVQ